MGPGFSIEKIRFKLNSLSGLNATYIDPRSKLKLFQIGELRMYPVFSSLFKKTIIINKIDISKPDIFVYVTPEEKIIAPWISMHEKKEEGKNPFSKIVVINRIKINDGSLSYSDNAIQNPPSQIKIENISTLISDLQFPSVSSKSSIDLNGDLNGGGGMYLNGWVDAKSQSSDISLKIKDANIKVFNPYIISKVPVDVNSGSADLTSQIIIKEKHLTMPGTLEIINLKTEANSSRQSGNLSKTMDSLLNQNRDRIKCEFTITGDFGDPNFNFSKSFVIALTKSIADTLGAEVKGRSIDKTKKAVKEGIKRGINQ